MKQRQVFMTAFDKKRLDELIEVAREFGEHTRKDLKDLAAEMSRAKVLEPDQVPADVVTMNSKVVLKDLDTAKEVTYTLVFPREADIKVNAISVLAPVGTAILGYKEGSVVEWPVPSGKRRIRIEKILYQPEAAGRYDQ
ncbi:MAG: nucleoside diphosphate kinase regulator [Kiritimatiellae bacterium]|nr:nucleoside diphosphate kinase regulator [Kiritimatiellia bacterium]